MPERSIIDAIISGAENSRWGRDPAHPTAPGSLQRFMTSLANEHPAAFLALFKKLIPNTIETESIEPQYTETTAERLQ